MKRMMRSLLALLLSVSMLIGTTYAWFTDSVKSGNNIITVGNLDLEVYWSENLASNRWKNAETDSEPIFNYDNWEPGYTSVRYIKLVNNGSLAFQYLLNILPAGEMGILADVIDVYYVDDVKQNVTSVSDMQAQGTLSEVVARNDTKHGVLLPADETKPGYISGEVIVAIAFKMQESAGNEYQGKSLDTTFAIQVLATQYMYENDSFGDDYDEEAEWPVVKDSVASAPVTPTAENKVPAGGVQMASRDDSISAYIPDGVLLKPGTKTLNLNVKKMNKSNANITLDENEKSVSLDVHIGEVDKSNQVVIKIEIKEALPVGLNMGNYRFYHVEDGATVAMTLLGAGDTPVHNSYEYDPATGDIVLYLKSFSEVAAVADTTSTWEKGVDYSWYNPDKTAYTIANADQLAAFGKIVGGMAVEEVGGVITQIHARDTFKGKTVKLLVNVNLGNNIFLPIGYYYDADENDDGSTNDPYSTVCAFEGTFDGNGHKVSNFIQRTWDIPGDDPHYDTSKEHYYNDGMGLFGYVVNGAVKNLTVDHFSCDGEFTPTGVIAAFAVNSAFENIAVTNCNPRVYNTGNGGIVGIGGNSDDKSDMKLTFKNITVDNTNKISALWGSWDVACGGIMGMFRGYGEVSFENCHVGAQIDVYNDVCGNYQYYWYRYAGMMIGSLRGRNIVQDGYTVPDTTGITAKNCTVHFGDWNNYYYCELVANSLASYTHDHQFSRLTEINAFSEIYDKHTGEWTQAGDFLLISDTGEKVCYHIVKDAQGNLVEHRHVDAGYETVNGEEVLKEDKQIVYLPFNQLFQGDGWGVKHIPIYDDGKVTFEGITILDRETAGSVAKFEETDEAKSIYPYGSTITIGQLFAASDIEDKSLTIKDGQVHVTVSPVVGSVDEISAQYTPNEADWTKGTLRFIGSGKALITITDYYFCTATTIKVEVTYSEGLDYEPTENGYVVIGSKNCKDTRVVIPAVHEGLPVVGIDDNAFEDNIGMTEVIIPNTVTSIGASAFYGCTDLTSIIIPESVTTMESNVFDGCTNLVSIFCEAAAKPDGWAEDWRDGCNAEDYWIDSEWNYLNGVPHVHQKTTIPEVKATCTEGGHKAGGLHCSVCEKIFEEPTPTPALGGEHVFVDGICRRCGCDEPISFTFENGVLTITGKGKVEPNKYGSYPWDSLRAKIASIVVGDNVTSIGVNAFSHCKNLESITYGEEVSRFELDAMAYCPKLTTIVFGCPVTFIGQGTVWTDDALTDVALKGQTKEDFLKVALVHAYNDPYEKAFVTWHNIVVDKEAVAPTCMNIGFTEASHCTHCDNFTKVQKEIPATGHIYNVEGVCWSCGCDEPISYTLVNGVLTITGKGPIVPDANGAYPWDSVKDQITSIVVGDNVTRIGESAFDACTNLVSATFGENVSALEKDALIGCSNLKTLVFEGTVTEIGQGVSLGCNSITSITITKQSVNSFRSLAIDTVYNDSLWRDTVNWTVECEHEWVSDDESKEATCIDCGFDGGVYCKYCKEVKVAPVVKPAIGHRFNANGNCTNEGCNTQEGVTWVISGGTLYIRGNGVVTANSQIEYDWYDERSKITQIVVGDGITEIGAWAFSGCNELEKITFGKQVSSLGYNALSYCFVLDEIVFNGKMETISEGIVHRCDLLEKVTITGQSISDFLCVAMTNHAYNQRFASPDVVWTVVCDHNLVPTPALDATCTDCGVTEGEHCAICGLVTVEQTTIPASNKTHSFENGTCKYCNHIEGYTYEISGGTLYIRGVGAVEEDSEEAYPWHNRKSEITAIIVGDGITKIGANAFKNCAGVKSITFGKSVTSIGQNAMTNCSRLYEIVFGASISSIGEAAVNGCHYIQKVTTTNQERADFIEKANVTAYNNAVFTSEAIKWTVVYTSETE